LTVRIDVQITRAGKIIKKRATNMAITVEALDCIIPSDNKRKGSGINGKEAIEPKTATIPITTARRGYMPKNPTPKNAHFRPMRSPSDFLSIYVSPNKISVLGR